MDLFDVFRITAKRWFISLPLVLVTAYFAYQAYSEVKPSYYTSVSVGIVSPSVKDIPLNSTSEAPTFQVSNGLQDAGGTALLANLLSIGLKDSTVRAQIASSGGSPSYGADVFSLPTTGQLPIVVINATGPSAASVSNTVSLVASQAEPTMKAIQAQAGVPESRMVTAFQLSTVPAPVGGLPGRTRQTASLAVGGVAGAVVASVLFDAAFNRLRRRKPKPAEDKAVEERVAGAEPLTRRTASSDPNSAGSWQDDRSSNSSDRGVHVGR